MYEQICRTVAVRIHHVQCMVECKRSGDCPLVYYGYFLIIARNTSLPIIKIIVRGTWSFYHKIIITVTIEIARTYFSNSGT